MTFDEARLKQLNRLDEAFAELRKIVADPTWTNLMFRSYAAAVEKFNGSLKMICELNAAENEAKD